MRHRQKSIWILILFLFGLWLPMVGCSRHSTGDSPSALKVVTEIEITFENGPIHGRRHYRDNEKMGQVLSYLRQIQPTGTVREEPVSLSGSLFQIRLIYSNGSEKIYRQKSDRYLSVDNGPWQTVNPKQASRLSLLLGRLDSDLEEI